MKCPTCNVNLVRSMCCGISADQCPSCKGVWFAPFELSSVIRSVGVPTSPGPAKKAPKSIKCPKCSTAVEPTIYAHDSGIPICKCPNCGGIWLVEGQLEEIANHRNGPHLTDELSEAIAADYARSNRGNKAIDWLKSRVLSSVLVTIMLAVNLSKGGGISGVIGVFISSIFPMACIWYSDSLGGLTRVRVGLINPVISQASPSIAIALGGWLLLFAQLFVVVYSSFPTR